MVKLERTDGDSVTVNVKLTAAVLSIVTCLAMVAGAAFLVQYRLGKVEDYLKDTVQPEIQRFHDHLVRVGDGPDLPKTPTKN